MLPSWIAIQLQYQNLTMRLALIKPPLDRIDALLDGRVGEGSVRRRERLGGPSRHRDKQDHEDERRPGRRIHMRSLIPFLGRTWRPTYR